MNNFLVDEEVGIDDGFLLPPEWIEKYERTCEKLELIKKSCFFEFFIKFICFSSGIKGVNNWK